MSPDPTSRVLHDIDDVLSRLRYFGLDRSLPNGNDHVRWVEPAAEAIRITAAHEEKGVVAWIDLVLQRVFIALASPDVSLRGELIRLAATVTAWVEDIDRKAGQ